MRLRIASDHGRANHRSLNDRRAKQPVPTPKLSVGNKGNGSEKTVSKDPVVRPNLSRLASGAPSQIIDRLRQLCQLLVHRLFFSSLTFFGELFLDFAIPTRFEDPLLFQSNLGPGRIMIKAISPRCREFREWNASNPQTVAKDDPDIVDLSDHEVEKLLTGESLQTDISLTLCLRPYLFPEAKILFLGLKLFFPALPGLIDLQRLCLKDRRSLAVLLPGELFKQVVLPGNQLPDFSKGFLLHGLLLQTIILLTEDLSFELRKTGFQS